MHIEVKFSFFPQNADLTPKMDDSGFENKHIWKLELKLAY